MITTGTVALEVLDGVALEIEWLFSEPRPGIRATVDLLLGKADAAQPR